MPSPPIEYGPIVETVAALARWFGISERTAHSWKAAGMPCNHDGTYSITAVLHWRHNRPNPEQWHATGNRQLAPREATGDLVRAIYRVLRSHIVVATANVLDDIAGDDAELRDKLLKSLATHFKAWALTDEEIEQTLIECWPSI